MSKEESDVHKSFKNIVLYSLSFATAMGLNEIIVSIFGKMKLFKTRLFAQIAYVIIMLCITLGVAYLLKQPVKNSLGSKNPKILIKISESNSVDTSTRNK